MQESFLSGCTGSGEGAADFECFHQIAALISYQLKAAGSDANSICD
jgi:hypothetical protein